MLELLEREEESAGDLITGECDLLLKGGVVLRVKVLIDDGFVPSQLLSLRRPSRKPLTKAFCSLTRYRYYPGGDGIWRKANDRLNGACSI